MKTLDISLKMHPIRSRRKTKSPLWLVFLKLMNCRTIYSYLISLGLNIGYGLNPCFPDAYLAFFGTPKHFAIINDA